MSRRLAVRRLPGHVPYVEAMRLQSALVQRRRAKSSPDTLLLLEHAPVFTLGRLQASAKNVLASPEAIAAAGASVVQSDRGGNVTFHGPGQLVAYPILDLKDHRRDLRWFVGALEEAMIATAAAYGVRAAAGGAGETGVWVEDRKIGAIGVRVQRWFSSHGVALNADVDLDYFGMIVPCGLEQRPKVTSLSREARGFDAVRVDDVAPRFVDAFASAFDVDPYEQQEQAWEAEVRRDPRVL